MVEGHEILFSFLLKLTNQILNSTRLVSVQSCLYIVYDVREDPSKVSSSHKLSDLRRQSQHPKFLIKSGERENSIFKLVSSRRITSTDFT